MKGRRLFTGKATRMTGVEFILGEQVAERLRNATLPPGVVVGVRPGDIQLTGEQNGAPMAGQIDLLQPVGPVTYAEILLAQGVKFVVSTVPGEFSVGQKVGVTFIPNKIHYFHQNTGDRLPV